MRAAEVDIRYLMFVVQEDEEVIKEKAEELALAIKQEFYLTHMGVSR